jgi:putative ABC transport system permease protein
MTGMLAFLENKWKETYPNMPFEYFFMKDDYLSLHKTENRAGKLIYIFTLLSIIISSVGLLGLISYATRQRTREIAVRKVLGASVNYILMLFSKEYSKWLLIATLIAWPLIYYFMDNWLQNFQYRIQMQWWVFLAGGVIALIIAVAIVSLQALKTAHANPAQTLKFE